MHLADGTAPGPASTGPLASSGIAAGDRADVTLPTLDSHRASQPMAPRMDIVAATHPGKERERNEDQFLVARLGRWVHIEQTSVGQPQELTSPQGTLLVVADGMGGHGAGDVASAVTLDAFVAHSLMEMPWILAGTTEGDALLTADMTRFVAECQQHLIQVAARKQLPPKLGTTLTAAFVQADRMVLAHVGDTRAYYWRAGQLVKLTRDHTLGAALAEEAKVDPSTVGHKNVLVNAIGGNADLPKPEMSSVTLQAGDRILLCSDGLHGSVPDARIAEHLGAAASAGDAVKALIDEALAAGGPDNITVMVAFG